MATFSDCLEAAVLAAQEATAYDHPRPDLLLEALEWDGARLCLGGHQARQWDAFPSPDTAWHAAEAAFLCTKGMRPFDED